MNEGPATKPGLALDRISLSHGGQPIVQSLSLTVAPGAVATLMGPSGSGKSSVLALICGTLDPSFRWSGRIVLNGVDLQGLPPERRRVGILFQDDLLFPHLSVGENLGFGLRAHLRDRRLRRELIEAALAEADLAGFAERDPATLSGGQRARVALMRTLLSEPQALLLDEPFAKLDSNLRQRFRAFVFDHAREKGLPTLLVTHDPDDAAAAGGSIVTLDPV